MADEMLNGRRCELARDRAVVAGLLAEYPREQVPVARPVTTLAELP